MRVRYHPTDCEIKSLPESLAQHCFSYLHWEIESQLLFDLENKAAFKVRSDACRQRCETIIAAIPLAELQKPESHYHIELEQLECPPKVVPIGHLQRLWSCELPVECFQGQLKNPLQLFVNRNNYYLQQA